MRCDARLSIDHITTSQLMSPGASVPGGLWHGGGGGDVGVGGGSGGGGQVKRSPGSSNSPARGSGRHRRRRSLSEDDVGIAVPDPMAQNLWTLHFTDAVTEREYFALRWGARRRLLRLAVPAAVGPARHCLPRHRIPSDSRNERSTYVG